MEAFGVTEYSKVDMLRNDPDLGEQSLQVYLDLEKDGNFLII